MRIKRMKVSEPGQCLVPRKNNGRTQGLAAGDWLGCVETVGLNAGAEGWREAGSQGEKAKTVPGGGEE